MAFERIMPSPGSGTGKMDEQVTAAWRARGGTNRKRVQVTLTKRMVEVLPWAAERVKVECFYCADTNRLRIAPAAPDAPLVFGLVAVGRSTPGRPTLTVALPLEHVPQTKGAVPAQVVPHEIEDGALILTLPAWAQDKAKVLARQAAERARGAFRMGSAA